MSIIGVNEEGYEASNELMCEGRDLPWLQETEADTVWDDWNVVYRDLIVIDGDNNWLLTYNLTQHDLGDPAQMNYLKSTLIEAAQ